MADETRPPGDPYYLASAQLLLLPEWTSEGMRTAPPPGGVSTAEAREPKLMARVTRIRRKLQNRFGPYTLRRRRPLRPAPVPPPPPPAPPISSVGVMDIGQGACNMLMNQTPDPVAYFDVGYPLWFFSSSPPNNIIYNNAAYAGPILQNQTNNLEVVLSHWDWDHWRLGWIAQLQNLNWLFPNQNYGPSAGNLVNLIPVGNRAVYGGAAVTQLPNYDLYQCVPPFGAPRSVILNNSGTAMSVKTNLPVADNAWHSIFMMADANFTSLQALAPLYPGVTGITAVHHGSNSDGALGGVPNPVFPYGAQGYIAYSYGIGSNLNHNYGFPVAAAVAQYQNLGWVHEWSTAEGQNLNANPVTRNNRGNIRMGNQTALNGAYNGTAFAQFPHQIQ